MRSLYHRPFDGFSKLFGRAKPQVTRRAARRQAHLHGRRLALEPLEQRMLLSLTLGYQFNGPGNWSIDAVGSNSSPVGTIQASVPVGSTVEAAFLYTSKASSGSAPNVTLEGVDYSGGAWTNLGYAGYLTAYRADVTTQVSALIGGGSVSTYNFTVYEPTDNSGTDGEVLAIVYSNPAELERTIAFFDGFSATGGDSATLVFPEPIEDPAAPDFEALMSLGIGYSYQQSGGGQRSIVDGDGRRLTSSAGGEDDGAPTNGGLITVGGIGDDPANPPDPFAGPSNPRTDDELYNLALGNLHDPTPFLSPGDTSFTIHTSNPSNDDNIFFLGFNVTTEFDPRIVGQSPSDPSIGPLGSVRLDFSEPIDQDSFSHEEDIVSFTGPEGPVAVTDHEWIDEDTVELTFDLQYVVGAYEMVVGPEIRDMEGNPMDEAQTVTFAVGAPQVLDHSPSGSVPGPIESLQLTFDHPMDQTSFLPDDDVISFTGPEGPLAASGFQWLGDQTLEILFDPQSSLGPYELVLGPEVLSLWNNPLDQDGDLVVAEAPDDWYTATFTIAGAKVVDHTPSGYVTAPVQKMQFAFDQPMEEISFLPEDDVVSFTGPNGPIAINDHRWVDPQTLELSFDQQNTAGEYELVLGPQILNLAGIAMDQDEDFSVGEVPDDQYTATFTRMFVSNITEDTVWGPIDPPIIFDSTVTVASGATLTIEAGSTLKFSGGAKLVVNGNLDVRGTLEEPVILTSFRDDEAGGDTNGDADATSPAANDWQGIRFNSSATGTLQNVEIAYASTAIDANAQYANVTLRNAVLRNGGRGIYVYSPYAQIDAENVLIADNQRTGVYMRASSGGVYRNCTIVGNGFGASGLERAGVHIGAATMLFDNCIVAFNANGINHSSADDSQTTVRNSAFYNPDGQDIIWTAGGEQPSLDQDGNLTADPLFVDRMAGNYELGPGSPAIDSGRGIQAPGEDILGRARRDDQGMPNVGTGYPSFVDMGAYERQEDCPTADLMVTYVSHPDPEIVTAGDTFNLEWTVSNIGAMETMGNWQDLVYLSDDPYLGGDALLATVGHTDPLAAGASSRRAPTER